MVFSTPQSTSSSWQKKPRRTELSCHSALGLSTERRHQRDFFGSGPKTITVLR